MQKICRRKEQYTYLYDRDPAQGNKAIKMRSGCVNQKTRQTHIHINTIKAPPSMSASTKKVVQPDHMLFLNSKLLFVQHFLPAS